jgi:hypothetical protein
LLIAGGAEDFVIRILSGIAGICLIVSGGVQFWMLRPRRWTADDPPY